MANEEHLARLKQGVEAWNQWREANPDIRLDLSRADLTRASLYRANLSRADLTRANLSGADLTQAYLTGADLSGADLTRANLFGAFLTGARLTGAFLTGANPYEADLAGADLSGVNLTGMDLRGANLSQADLTGADLTGANLIGTNLFGAFLTGAFLTGAFLTGANLVEANFTGANLTRAKPIGANLTSAQLIRADLTGADLTRATLVKTNFTGANLTGCRVYGISAWDVNLTGAQQSDLVITAPNEPVITVDNLEVAQFIYLLLHNEKIRHVIETVTSKAVLILGRFTPERKAVLDAIREELRKRDRLPILFDFTPPTGPTLLETVSALAHMARFVIADLTDAKSILQELTAIVPYSPTLVVQPIILASQEEPSMWDFFRRFPWVLEPYRYHSLDEVRASLEDKIITPAALKAEELLGQ